MDIIGRAQNIILKPKETFLLIKDESSSIKDLYVKYSMILAIIPAIADFIGKTFIGAQFIRISIANALLLSFASYFCDLLILFLTAFLMNLLLPSFSVKKDINAITKIMVFSATAIWLIRFINIIPMLSPFIFVGFCYSIYLVYIGGPIILNISEEKAIAFAAITVGIALIMIIVLKFAVATLTIPLTLGFPS